MAVALDPCPRWAEQALQGLTFWVGHRRALYRYYPLSEGALVAEACNLIHAHLGDDELLLCEEQYRRLLPAAHTRGTVGMKSRADLAIVRGLTSAQAKEGRSLAHNITAVVEVKRASAPGAQIDWDLYRLATIKAAVPNVRALMFVVSEARRPSRFVSEAGRAILGAPLVPKADATYRVRRVCKASAAFGGKETAHYACIVEVFNQTGL